MPKKPRVDLDYLAREIGVDQDAIDREVRDIGVTAAEAATRMALSGAPYTEIAQVCGYHSPASARTAVMRVIAAGHDNTDDYRAMRQMESQRIMGLLRSVWDKATDQSDIDHLAYNRQAATLVAQHAKLHGLDAPQAVTFISPEHDVFEQVVQRTAEALTAGAAQEADIFAEVIEDDAEEAS